jgi:hypothetical protein
LKGQKIIHVLSPSHDNTSKKIQGKNKNNKTHITTTTIRAIRGRRLLAHVNKKGDGDALESTMEMARRSHDGCYA